MKVQISQTSALHEKGSRFKNEDFIYPILDGAEIDPSVAEAIPNIPGLYMICDGVGGEQKGEIASQLAVAQFAKYFEVFPPKGRVTYGYLSAALIRVEEAFSNNIKGHPESRGMATTLSLLYIDDHGAIIAWIGDSRVYHYRGNNLVFKTRDHSQVNKLLDQGEISEEEAKTHPQRNVVLRSIQGTENPTDMDTHFIPVEELEANDYFFICSDGILEEVDESELKTLFGSDIGLEDIRQEIFSLCKGSSRDNFSCYLIQVGEVDKTGLTAAIPLADEVTELEEELLLDSVAEPPVEEESSIEDEVKEGTTVLDRLGHGIGTEKAEKSHAEAGTLYDRIQQGKEVHKEKVDSGTTNGTQIKDEPVIINQESSGWQTPAILGALLLIALVSAVWYFWPDSQKRSIEKYEVYKSQAINSMKADNWNRAMLYSDSAYAVATALDDLEKKKDIGDLYKGIEKEKREDISDLFAEAKYYREKESYPGYWQATELYNAALNDHAFLTRTPNRAAAFGNIVDTARVNKELAETKALMGKISDAKALKQFLTEAMSLCELKKGDEADAYFAAASSLADKLNKKDDLLQAQKVCSEANQIADGSTPPARKTEPAKSDDTKSKAIPSPAKTTPSVLDKPGPQTKESTGPVAGTTARKSSKSTTGAVATKASNLAPTAEQIRNLEKAKVLFTKSRTSLSAYEEKKAVEYFLKSGNAIDGEGYYMLAFLHHEGFAVDMDDDKALEYAQKSAKENYPGGHYYYASLLLDRGNSKDSLTAKSSLNIAASKGFQQANNKLFELQTEMAARRKQ